jgi:hypothetical protein
MSTDALIAEMKGRTRPSQYANTCCDHLQQLLHVTVLVRRRNDCSLLR